MNMVIVLRTCGGTKRGFLKRLLHDRSGNVLAFSAAGIMALMAMIGGAVDMSRSYMVSSRLQQACDAGALAARKAMSGESLTAANKNVGYRYFDFNFPAGTLGTTLTSRAYTQPTSSQGTPQAIVNGLVIAAVPTTIMRAFGNQEVDLRITCSSKMEIQSADIAMVLDVTGSMSENIRISSTGTATEDRIKALHKAVRAFYTALGPGRAGGDLSRGRIRYAFIPYGTVVNVGQLLSHDQMVSSASYQSRQAVTETLYGYTLGNEASKNWGSGWSNNLPTNLNNQSAWSVWTDVSTSGGTTVTINGTNYSKRWNVDATTCNNANGIGPTGNRMAAYVDSSSQGAESLQNTTNDPPVRTGPGTPSQQVLSYTQNDVHTVTGYKYQYYSTASGSEKCRLQRASNTRTYTNERSGTSTRSISWTTYTGTRLRYEPRTIDVSGLKAMLGGWNDTITVPAMKINGGTSTTYNNVTLSGTSTPQSLTFYTGTPQSDTFTWRGCIEERQMVNTITPTTALDAIPTGAYDLDSTLLATPGNDATRWRPWLSQVIYNPSSKRAMAGIYDSYGELTGYNEECPAPALRLQEFADYDLTTLDTDYPMLFDDTSGGPSSYYYPYTTSRWGTTSTPANLRTKNSATLRNYIERIDATRGLVDGTTHDAGFIWGLHLVSGDGMFAADNPDRFNGQAVNRNIVFMTDGEMNPGEERYVFSGWNQADGRLAPASSTQTQMIAIQNRRLRIQCEAAKRQGITVWVVAITQSSTSGENFDDLRACASSSGNFKSAATSQELIQSFTMIANSIGGLRISQ